MKNYLCPNCEEYRHNKSASLLDLFWGNNGWCIRCCNSDGSPKSFELTEEEKREQDELDQELEEPSLDYQIAKERGANTSYDDKE